MILFIENMDFHVKSMIVSTILTLGNKENLTTTPKRDGLKGDPNRVKLLPKFELLYVFVLLALPFYIFSDLLFVKTDRTDTISFCPEVPAPVSFF